MPNLTADSLAVQSYLNILQGIVGRMAANSANCKTWCITAVSALLVVMADKHKPEMVSVLVVPVVLFGFLDAYYLGIERSFRERYDTFIGALHDGTAGIKDVYGLPRPSSGELAKRTISAIASISVAPFYLLMLATLAIAKRVLL